MTNPVCAVVGVGPGNGAAFARRFATAGYDVALLARNHDYLSELATAVPRSRPYRCDVLEPDEPAATLARVAEEMGEVAVLVYNAGSGQFGTLDETTPETFERAWRINALGCLEAAQQVLPAMRSNGGGSLIIIGATASLRGGARFTAFASAKAAQRSLAQSMARHLGKDGIHVAYVIIDGVIDLPRTRERLPDKPDSFYLKPDDIAESVFFLTQQPRSAWTFELDLRPYAESW